MNIKLGDKVRDKITGFKGSAVARTEWLNGCVRITIQPQAIKDGKPVGTDCFDIEQIKVIGKSSLSVTKTSGGPMPAVNRNPDPTRF
jgi:hypothetical protein